MRILNISDLRNGMIVGYNVLLNNNVVINKHTVLTDEKIQLLSSLFPTNHKVWILDLAEIKPILYKDSSLTRQYIDFIFNAFRSIFDSVALDTDCVDSLVQRVYRYLFTNRAMLYETIVLRDNHCYTYEHSLNVAMYSMLIGLKLEVTTTELQDLMLGCILHDFGKRSISNTILDKPSKLDDSEFKAIKQHPLYGVELTSTLDCVNPRVIDVICQHHEKLDGSGYPYNLKDGEICHLAKITAVSDIFDAVISKRSYHEKKSVKYGLDILQGDVSKGKIGKEEYLALADHIILYPMNYIVVLNNGETGLVMENCKTTRPKVLGYSGKVFDLQKDKSLSIQEVI